MRAPRFRRDFAMVSGRRDGVRRRILAPALRRGTENAPMTGFRFGRRLALASLLMAGIGAGQALAGSVGTPEFTVFAQLQPAPAAPAGAALLNTPPGWQRGEAAALVLADAGWDRTARDRLTAGLLEAGLAVLELPAAPPGGVAAVVGGALRQLRQGGAAGPVVAIGHDAAGRALLAAGPELGDIAAIATLGPAPRIRIGGDGATAASLLTDTARLCQVLAAGQGEGAFGFEAACVSALIQAAVQ
jgi:hypothetical protein